MSFLHFVKKKHKANKLLREKNREKKKNVSTINKLGDGVVVSDTNEGGAAGDMKLMCGGDLISNYSNGSSLTLTPGSYTSSSTGAIQGGWNFIIVDTNGTELMRKESIGVQCDLTTKSSSQLEILNIVECDLISHESTSEENIDTPSKSIAAVDMCEHGGRLLLPPLIRQNLLYRSGRLCYWNMCERTHWHKFRSLQHVGAMCSEDPDTDEDSTLMLLADVVRSNCNRDTAIGLAATTFTILSFYINS